MAPRRQPTPLNPAATRSPGDDTEEGTETIAERHQRLRAAIQERRQLQEIDEMERELAGSSPASSVLGGPSSLGKRPASQDLTTRHRRAFPPPPYRGASVKDLRDFLLGCNVYFGAVEEYDERRRV